MLIFGVLKSCDAMYACARLSIITSETVSPDSNSLLKSRISVFGAVPGTIVCNDPVVVTSSTVANPSTAVYMFSMFVSCSTSVMFLPYRICTPLSEPRCARSFTVKLSHSYSPPNTSRIEPRYPPRHSRKYFGSCSVNVDVGFTISVNTLNSYDVTRCDTRPFSELVEPVAVNGNTGALFRSYVM